MYLYLVLTLLVVLLFPSGNVQLFVPFLVYLFYRQTKMGAIWWSVGCGLVEDLLSPHTPFGLFAFVYALTTYLLYEKKQHFFIDSFSTFPLMSFLYAALSTAMLALIIQIPLSISWIMTDLILVPFAVSLIAFICYTLPYWALRPRRRRGEEYFL